MGKEGLMGGIRRMGVNAREEGVNAWLTKAWGTHQCEFSNNLGGEKFPGEEKCLSCRFYRSWLYIL